MIDPISAFGALTAAHGAIKKCVEMGKDLASASSAIEKYAKAEAELGFGKERKKKKSLFGGIMDSAIEQHFKEEEQARLKKELRSLFQLYGSHGQWERLQATIARARAEHKKQLEAQAKRRDAIVKSLTIVITLTVGGIGLYYLAIYLKGTL